MSPHLDNDLMRLKIRNEVDQPYRMEIQFKD